MSQWQFSCWLAHMADTSLHDSPLHCYMTIFTLMPSASFIVICCAVILLRHALETWYSLHAQLLQMQVQVCCSQFTYSYWRCIQMVSLRVYFFAAAQAAA